MSSGTYPRSLKYKIDGVDRNKPYLLSDVLYPKATPFVRSIV